MVTDALKRTLVRRAAKATVRHSAHGIVARVQRKPARSAGLLAAGAAVGAAAGWLARGLGR
jgi:hypothetical protein